jgi:hypothetical protein
MQKTCLYLLVQCRHVIFNITVSFGFDTHVRWEIKLILSSAYTAQNFSFLQSKSQGHQPAGVWKLFGEDDNSGSIDTPSKLLCLRDVAAAGLLPSLTTTSTDDIDPGGIGGFSRQIFFWPNWEEERVNYPTRRKDSRVNYPTRR